jgi:heterogeneous nuclear ribonucleoprotein A/B/D
MSSAGRAAQKLFVHNLPWTVNSQKLKTYFANYGKVAAANVIFDKNTGLSRGYGFIVFSNSTGYEAATTVAKHSIEGNVISLQPAK